jgi:hypothetical protein
MPPRKTCASTTTNPPPRTTLIGAPEVYALARAYEAAGAWEAALACYTQAYVMFPEHAPQNPAVGIVKLMQNRSQTPSP